MRLHGEHFPGQRRAAAWMLWISGMTYRQIGLVMTAQNMVARYRGDLERRHRRMEAQAARGIGPAWLTRLRAAGAL